MIVLTDKLQIIYNQLSSLLSLFKKNINIIKFSFLSKQIEEMIIGENKISRYVDKSIVTITEDDLKRVGYSLKSNIFNNCKNLTNINIPNTITHIYNSAFYNCSSLKKITIPDSVTNLGQTAFCKCSSLTEITIPDGVTNMANYIFTECSSLTDIYLNPTAPPSLGGTDAIPSTTTIHVPVGSGDAYKAATNWSYHSSRIVEDIEL